MRYFRSKKKYKGKDDILVDILKEKPVSLPKEYLKKYPIIIQYTPPK